MDRLSTSLLSLLALGSLNSCSLEDLEVEPCELGETIGFRISPIDGWLRDYQPRPNELYVRVDDSRSYQDAVVWATRLNYDDVEKRNAQTLIAYGQWISGWEVQQPAKPLSEGVSYSINISDGGHHGWTKFAVEEQLPAC